MSYGVLLYYSGRRNYNSITLYGLPLRVVTAAAVITARRVRVISGFVFCFIRDRRRTENVITKPIVSNLVVMSSERRDDVNDY